MYLDAAKKQEIFGKYGKSNSDTGSAEAQIALFSYRISHLTEHMKLNRKDYSTERALTMLVGKRRRLLDYLKAKDIVPSSKLLDCVSNPLVTNKIKRSRFSEKKKRLLFFSPPSVIVLPELSLNPSYAIP